MQDVGIKVHTFARIYDNKKPQILDPAPPFLQGRSTSETDLDVKFNVFHFKPTIQLLYCVCCAKYLKLKLQPNLNRQAIRIARINCLSSLIADG